MGKGKEGGGGTPNTSREGGRVDDRGRLNTTGPNFCASIIHFISRRKEGRDRSLEQKGRKNEYRYILGGKNERRVKL